MSATIQLLEVSGLKEALKEINKLDKKLRREITKDFEKAVSPMVDAMRADVPLTPPLSGFANKSRTQWKKNEQKNIKVKIDTRRARNRNMAQGAQYESLGVVKIRAMSAGLSIFDMAGKNGSKTTRGENMVETLQARFGNPSRIMWPNAEKHAQEVEVNLEAVVRKVEREYKRLMGGN
jgi:hypothetical protein